MKQITIDLDKALRWLPWVLAVALLVALVWTFLDLRSDLSQATHSEIQTQQIAITLQGNLTSAVRAANQDIQAFTAYVHAVDESGLVSAKADTVLARWQRFADTLGIRLK